jgi:hypothetical protein
MKYTSIFTLTLLAAVPALAYDTSWVSHSGSDALGCGTTAAPCRMFQFAYNNATSSGGIIKAMDAGEYGPINIAGNPVTIDGNGVGASIGATSAAGFGVFLSYPGGTVVIRNLTIHVPASCNCPGIRINSGSPVIIENVSITGAPSYGVFLQSINNGEPLATAAIHGLTVTNATLAGIYVEASTATISDSIVQFSPNYGIFLVGNVNGATQVLIERSKIISNGVGLLVSNAGATATARISDCVITGNTTGVTTSGGQIITFRNNTWAGNTTDGTTPFSVSQK